MGPEDIAYFKKILSEQLNSLSDRAEETIRDLGSAGATNYPDPGDRAMAESNDVRDLRIQDRERKLGSKIREALQRISNGSFGNCEICEEPIDIERLKARPVTTLCIECKQQQEDLEKRRKL
jgi:DnaK suppressor protein